MKKLTLISLCLLPLLTGCGEVVVHTHKIQKAITFCKGSEKVSNLHVYSNNDSPHDTVTCLNGSKEYLNNIVIENQ